MVPDNWRLGPDEAKYVISDMSPTMIFASSEFQPMAASLASEFGSIRDRYSMDNAAWEFAPFDVLTAADGASPPTDMNCDDAYVVFHTAAVDGRSRGAIRSHRGLVLSGLQITGQPLGKAN